MKPRILLYGAGGHGKVVADAVEREGRYELAGFVDDRPLREFFGLPVMGTGEALESIRGSGIEHAVSCVGDARTRETLDRKLEAAGFSLATVVHPSAQVARGVTVGDGTIIMPGVIVGPDTIIGRSCIVNTSASVDHDCRIEDYVHVAPGVTVCGGVSVGRNSLIGAGATVLPGRAVGAGVTVGGGATVTQNVPDGVTAVGTPARIVARTRKA